jgi:prepilin-type N-terminal cleavage/methylation domain-containing protein
MRKNFANKIIFNNKGITLVELLIVLVLLAVVMVPAYNAIGVTNRIWSHNEAINPGITQANVAMTYISREIRESAQPSKTVDSVIVEDSGQSLVIYRYNEKNAEWEKIIYKTVNNKLNRIILSKDDPADIISAAIPGSTDAGWNTLVEGVSSNPVFTRPAKSRAVEVHLQVSDNANNNPRFSPYTVASTYMVRSREVGAITGEPVADETGTTTVSVNKVVLDSNAVTLRILGVNQTTLTATIWPANATDKSITWTTSHPDWVTVEPINNGKQAIIKLIKTKDDFSWLQWETFRVPFGYFPPDVTITAIPAGGGKNDTCTITVRKNA